MTFWCTILVRTILECTDSPCFDHVVWEFIPAVDNSLTAEDVSAMLKATPVPVDVRFVAITSCVGKHFV